MRWFDLAIVGVIACPVGFATSAAGQDAPRAVPVKVMVTHLSDDEAGVDPRAREIAERLRKQHIQYQSVQVVQERQLDLEPGEISVIPLSDGGTVSIQLMHLGDQGALMAVDVQNGITTDVRVPDDHMVVIDAGRVGGGKRVISIQPDYE